MNEETLWDLRINILKGFPRNYIYITWPIQVWEQKATKQPQYCDFQDEYNNQISQLQLI